MEGELVDVQEIPEVTLTRGGVRFDEVTIVQSGGWCAPGDFLKDIFDAMPAEPIPPCDGVNHRWERMTSSCHECNQAVPPRRLECEACDTELREDAEGMPAGHFDRLWAVAPAW